MLATSLTSSSINALQKEYETIANNLANVNTPSFKRTVNKFSRIMNEAASDVNENLESTNVNDDLAVDYSQGGLVQTGRQLDLALSGPGFYVLETESGPLYTRNGSFGINPQGQLVDAEGNLVGGEMGPILIPKQVAISEISVSSDGAVKAGDATLGKIKVVDFSANMHQLTAVGKGKFYVDPEVPVEKVSNPNVKQGYTESSNVNMMEELVGLMTVTRMYEANMKILAKQSEDDRKILDVAMG